MFVLLKSTLVFVVICLVSQPTNAFEGELVNIVLGSYSSPLNADKMREFEQSFTEELLNVKPARHRGPLYRVIAGPFNSAEEANQLLLIFRQRVPDAWLDFPDVASSVSGTIARKPEVEISQAISEKRFIVVDQFANYEAAVASAELLSSQFAMPLMISPMLDNAAISMPVEQRDQSFRVHTLAMDQTIAPLVLELIRVSFPLAVLEPSAD